MQAIHQKTGYPVVVKQDNGVGASLTFRIENDKFETANVTFVSIMDVVNTKDNAKYYIVKELPEDIREAGHAAVKSFGVKSRFIHIEFFRLLADHEGLGKKGDLLALEVNMRPCGGFAPDVLSDAMRDQMYAANFMSREEMEQFCAYVLKENFAKIQLETL